MSQGGLIDLAARGIHDEYLIGNPQITFFKAVYKTHTNFSIEPKTIIFDGEGRFGETIRAKIPRNGDLLGALWLKIDLPLISSEREGLQGGGVISYVNSIGHAIIDYVEIQIGKQAIDRHYGEWLEIYNQLTMKEEYKYGFQEILRRYDTFTINKGGCSLRVPLQFWFCRNVALALPLVALMYHDVEIILKLKPLAQLYSFGNLNYYVGGRSGSTVSITSSNPEFDASDVGKIIVWDDGTEATIDSYVSTTQITTLTSGSVASQSFYIKPNDRLAGNPKLTSIALVGDYIYLDSKERKLFASLEHKYLIEQVKATGSVSVPANVASYKFDFDEFNLPIKSLYWVIQNQFISRENNVFNFSHTVNHNEPKADPMASALIRLDGIPRMEELDALHYRIMEPLRHHSRVPNEYIYMFSFALKPEELQPSGTVNMSRINTKSLEFHFRSGIQAADIRIYGLNYNILNIKSGMGAILFSN